MTIDFFKRLGLFVALLLAQGLVLNQIHLFGCAMPLLYVYMVIGFPCGYPKWASMLWAFLLGISVDTFANTPGVAAASLTAVAALQPYYVRLFIANDAQEDTHSTLADMGAFNYTIYALTLVLLYCLLFFTLESFSFFNLLQWVECVLGSSLLTIVLILTLESIRRK